jgi:hypothetical protein
MALSRRTVAVMAGSAVAAAALAVAAILVLTSRSTPAKPALTAHASTPAAAGLTSPVTGEPVRTLGPVIAVKIDNIVNARPQTGINSADIVYVLPVEGGLSRFMAIFSSRLPPVIGPVRSAREDDIELLGQFGRPAYAFSGAQPQLLPVVENSRIVNLYAGIAGGYFRDPSRIAPYNLYARGSALLAESRGASDARDIGFRFGAAPAGGRPESAFSVGYSAASFQFRWSPGTARWLVWMDGSPARTTDGGQMDPATVVIQYTTIGTSRFLERGVRPPYAQSTGSGTAVVLRGGRAYDVHWSRPAAGSGTTFTLASGRRMTFARGQVWVVFAQSGG